MDGRFQPGDARINRKGRPVQRSLASAVAAVISASDVEKVARNMKILALAGDPNAAQAVAALVAIGLSAAGKAKD